MHGTRDHSCLKQGSKMHMMGLGGEGKAILKNGISSACTYELIILRMQCLPC